MGLFKNSLELISEVSNTDTLNKYTKNSQTITGLEFDNLMDSMEKLAPEEFQYTAESVVLRHVERMNKYVAEMGDLIKYMNYNGIDDFGYAVLNVAEANNLNFNDIAIGISEDALLEAEDASRRICPECGNPIKKCTCKHVKESADLEDVVRTMSDVEKVWILNNYNENTDSFATPYSESAINREIKYRLENRVPHIDFSGIDEEVITKGFHKLLKEEHSRSFDGETYMSIEEDYDPAKYKIDANDKSKVIKEVLRRVGKSKKLAKCTPDQKKKIQNDLQKTLDKEYADIKKAWEAGYDGNMSVIDFIFRAFIGNYLRAGAISFGMLASLPMSIRNSLKNDGKKKLHEGYADQEDCYKVIKECMDNSIPMYIIEDTKPINEFVGWLTGSANKANKDAFLKIHNGVMNGTMPLDTSYKQAYNKYAKGAFKVGAARLGAGLALYGAKKLYDRYKANKANQPQPNQAQY